MAILKSDDDPALVEFTESLHNLFSIDELIPNRHRGYGMVFLGLEKLKDTYVDGTPKSILKKNPKLDEVVVIWLRSSKPNCSNALQSVKIFPAVIDYLIELRKELNRPVIDSDWAEEKAEFHRRGYPQMYLVEHYYQSISEEVLARLKSRQLKTA